MRLLSLRALIVFCVVSTFAGSAFAQATGTVHGVVRDASGAVVPAARVVVTNVDSNQSRTLTSSGEGQYLAPMLPVGNYNIKVEKEGFQAFLQTGVTVAVNLNIQVDATLALTAAVSEITVNAAPPLVQSTTTNLVQIVGQREMVDLPLNGRNVLQLTAMDAGITNDPRAAEGVLQGATVGQGFYNVIISANGSRPNQSNYLLDNVDNNDNYTNINAPYPNPDAVEEFSVQTSSFDAQYGRGIGAVINVVTRSGSNTIHGSAFEFLRNYKMNARNFFTGIDSLKRNQFGGSLGGPLVFPRVYNGKNKTFLFGSYQGTRQRVATSQIVTAPSAAMEQGNFSAWLGANGVGVINDPLSGQPFPGNIIPVSRFDPVSAKLLNYFPPSSSSNYQMLLPTPSTELDDDQITARIDHNISDVQHVSFHYFRVNYDNPYLTLPNNLLWINVGSKDVYQSGVFNHTYLFSSRLLNEFSIGLHRSTALLIPPADLSNCCSLSGLGGRVQTVPQNENLAISISGWTGVTEAFHRDQRQTTYLASDNVSYTLGRHHLRFGGDVQRYRIDYTSYFDADPAVTFGGQVTGVSGKTNAGNGFADFVLGAFTTFRQQSISGYRLYNTFSGFYIQDDAQLTSKLSINIGLRWQPTLFQTDKFHQITMFSPGSQSTAFPSAPPNLLFYGDKGVGNPLVPDDWHVFAPRLGLAYQASPRLVIRSAYGIFFDQYMMIASNRTMQAPPWVDQVSLGATGYLANPYGSGTPISVEHGSPSPNVPFIPYSVFALPSQALVPAYTQSWNFVLERQITSDLVVRAAYVGSKATHLMLTAEINPAIYGAGATVGNENQRRIYPLIAGMQLGEPGGWATYQGGQFSVDKRFRHGFMVKANYTVSKSIDIGSYGTAETNTIGPNPFNWNANRGPSDFDYPQRLVLSGVWAHPELKNWNPVLRTVLGGWQSNFIYTAQAGTPLNIVSGVDNSLSGVGADMADLTGTSWRLDDSRTEAAKILQWFNPAAFKQNTVGTFGTGGRNQLRVPGTSNLDYSLFKNFAIREKAKLQYRGEFFNVLNHTNLGAPSNSVVSTTFGRISSASAPRIIQMSLKLVF